jgi:hypothetical protein
MTTRERRATWISTYDLHRLDIAVTPLRRLCPDIYLVGTVLTSPDWRDVDVRMIMADDEFDATFGNSLLWETFCLATTSWLRSQTGLPIDFQVQRMTEANERHPGIRNHLSGGRREYAGLGDATPYVCPECGGSGRVKAKGFSDGKPRGTASCPSCARAALREDA